MLVKGCPHQEVLRRFSEQDGSGSHLLSPTPSVSDCVAHLSLYVNVRNSLLCLSPQTSEVTLGHSLELPGSDITLEWEEKDDNQKNYL